MSDELPEGWVATALKAGLVSNIQTGFACGKHSRDERGVAHLRPMNVSEAGLIVLDDVKYIDASEVDRDERRLRRGDVVFNNTNSPELVGKTALYEFDEPRAFSNHMTRLRCADALEPKLCAFLLHHRWQQGEFFEKCNNHVSQASVGREVLLDTELLLPPLPEQRRIVTQVEALLEKVNSAKGRLDRVPLILKRFRQALMLAACSGRLTEDWRKKHPDSVVASSRNDIDTSPLPEIPETWSWVRLTDLGELARGKSRHRPRNDPQLYSGRYPFIQTGDVARSGGRITEHTQTYNEAGLAQSRLWPKHTVCITIAANIAESGLLTYAACFPDSVVGLITNRSVCLPEYAEFFIRTARASLSQFAPATAQANINMEILSTEVAVPLPPVAEQVEIVRVADSLLKFADTIERRVLAATARADKLPQAILSKAFSGELVPTEAELARAEGRTYETAEELLARIANSNGAAGVSETATKRGKSSRSKGVAHREKSSRA